MCGIAGIIGKDSRSRPTLARMGQAIAHRGPDDDGLWHDDASPVGFAHRRLAIVDLSPAGHQPMHGSDGRWTIVFNGEIYNHQEIRRELDNGERIAWRGHSDTETLVEAVARWGLQPAIERCVGMFAIALWNRSERQLSLVRDRFGEKPLYYGWAAGNFVFASELKAIRSIDGFDNDIDRRAVQLLAERGYIPAPFSIYRRLFKLDPATILTIDLDVAATPHDAPPAGERGFRTTRYWSYRQVVEDGAARPFASNDEAIERVDTALRAAIEGQAVADVPVGAFLSGGIDSSAVVAAYHERFPGKVKTFTIGFEEAGYDEADHARAVARHFRTEHFEHRVTVAEAQAVIPLLPTMFDEPFADSSQIPTHLVSRLARQHVTVALSGDGGDELFGGYDRYRATERLWRNLDRLPRPARQAAGAALHAVPPALWNGLMALAPAGRRPAHFGHRLRKYFATIRDSDGFGDVIASFLNEWPDGSPVVRPEPLPLTAGFNGHIPAIGEVGQMMYADAVSYLPGDILCKVDRAAMAVSLETRVPLLDHRLAELAAQIPPAMRFEDGTGKAVLRSLLYRKAPRSLFERSKAGFAIPVGDWLRGDLRDWAEDLLDPASLAADGYFDPAVIGPRWTDHLSGRRDSTQAIWTVLMFQSWVRVQNTR